MPLIRRLPKRGFHNIFGKTYRTVNVDRLNKFESGTVINPEVLLKAGLLRKGKDAVNIRNVMILGGGLVGQLAARALQREMQVKLIESRADRSDDLAEILPETLVIRGDGIDMDLLAAEGITDMDALVAVTGDDETNIIATLLARHLKVPRTVALVNRTEYLPITPTIGMDAVVSKQLLTVNAVHRHIQEQQVAAMASVPGMDAQIIEYIVDENSP